MPLFVPDILKATLKLQPVILLYSAVSICSKIASGLLPAWKGSLPGFFMDCLSNFRLTAIVFTMFVLLAGYAVIWQMVIKRARIAVIYANKSSYLFWTQLAAVWFFGESISLSNLAGIALIFSGILIGNCDLYESA